MIIDDDLRSLVSTSKMKSGNNYGTGMLIVHPVTKKLLLGRRTDTHNMCSPGGKVEVGESPLQGVIRETMEESNIKVNNAKFYDYEMHTAENGKNWTSFMFYCDDFDDSDIQNQESEVEPWDWYSLEDALSMDLFPPTRKSIERAVHAGLLGNNNFEHPHPFVAENTTSGIDPADPDGCPVERDPMSYPKPSYIPFVNVPVVPFVHDSCPCAYSYQEPDPFAFM